MKRVPTSFTIGVTVGKHIRTAGVDVRDGVQYLGHGLMFWASYIASNTKQFAKGVAGGIRG